MWAGSTTLLTNTILAYSPAGGNCIGNISSSQHSISSDSTCVLTSTDNLTGTDPLLTALGNYGGPTQVHMLLPGSPAIDAGMADGAPASDQRGQARPVDGDGNNSIAYDIGAVERQPGDSNLAPRLYLPALLR
jgi:hypothetical protein